MKKCARCQVFKEEDKFNKCKAKKDGLSVYCKICKSLESKEYNKNNREKCAEKLRKWREKNPEKNKEYSKTNRERNDLEIIARRRTPKARKKMLALVKEWRLKNPERHRETQKKWKEANRLKINARFRVTNAIRRGKMIRGTKCETCGSGLGKMEAHHKDYSKPLEVNWLCSICHRHEHGKLLDVSPNA